MSPPASLPTLWDLPSTSDCLPKMQLLPQGCCEDGEGLQAQLVQKGDLGGSQHWGWGQCHEMLWDSPGSLHLTGEGFLLAHWAAWSWFMPHNWTPLSWDVLVLLSLQSGRKIHVGNYLFLLARVS